MYLAFSCQRQVRCEAGHLRKFKISPRGDSNSRTNTSSNRGLPLVHRGDRLWLCMLYIKIRIYYDIYQVHLRDVDDLTSRGCRKLKTGDTDRRSYVYGRCEFTCVAPPLLLLLCRCCTARMLLKFRGTVGWNLFLVDMCSGWPAHIIRAHTHTEAPLVAVTKQLP